MEMHKTHNREILEGLDKINLGVSSLQNSEVARMRTCEYRQVLGFSVLTATY
jgi:hypothetical protein